MLDKDSTKYQKETSYNIIIICSKKKYHHFSSDINKPSHLISSNTIDYTPPTCSNQGQQYQNPNHAQTTNHDTEQLLPMFSNQNQK